MCSLTSIVELHQQTSKHHLQAAEALQKLQSVHLLESQRAAPSFGISTPRWTEDD